MSGHDRRSQFDGHVMPGRQTLVQPSFGADVGKRSLAQDLPPVQLKGPFDPTTVQVDQYKGTTKNKDCGPAVVLMVIRAIGCEDAFKALVARAIAPNTVYLQDELNYIRDPDHPASDFPFTVDMVRSSLIRILHTLGIHLDAKHDDMLSTFVLAQEQKDTPPTKEGIEPFLAAHCENGSAVIALGKPNNAAWGWGGEKDKVNNGREVTDVDGDHFVMIWSDTPGAYIVLDPAWLAPQQPMDITKIVAFLSARGKGSSANLMAVPFEMIEQHMHHMRASARAGAVPKATGPTRAAPEPASGGGTKLPAITLAKMQRAFSADFSDVSVHESGNAETVGAQAYAQGSQLHFARGHYYPNTPEGDRLIGHELAHVIQQRQGRVPAGQAGTNIVQDAALESEADALGDRAAAGEVGVAGAHTAGTTQHDAALQRKPGSDLPLPIAMISDVEKARRSKSILAFHAAVLALHYQCRRSVPAVDDVRAYAESGVDSETKRATIGRMAASRARLEFLIGWMLQGGIRDQNGNWEDQAGKNNQGADQTSNHGTLVNEYEGTKPGYGADGNDWCGIFVGEIFSRLGMSTSSKAKHREYLSLESVAKINDWIDNHPAGTGERRWRPSQFLDPAMQPQPGDVVVFDEHIAMVESCSYEPRGGTKTISTIEGNVGLEITKTADNAVSGAKYTIPQAPTEKQIKLIWRPALEAFGGKAVPHTTGQSVDNADGEALVRRIELAAHQIVELYRRLHLDGVVGDNMSVAAMADASAHQTDTSGHHK